MRLSTKGRFAVTAMIDVALRGEYGPVPLTEVASRQHISLSYLEQLFSKLRRHGLVTSMRGPGGGYSLGGQMDSITVADIICAVEDEPLKAKQVDASAVQDMTQDLWDTMNAKVLNLTQSVTLRSLVLDQLAMGVEMVQKTPPNRGVFKKPVQPTIQPDVPNSVFALGQTFRVQG
jgi:Rrf2 family transcriptional regulator, iron-sulfur cluster assembly transcription factor